MLKEWEKIKDADVFDCLDSFAILYFENGEKVCFRKFTAYPWSKDNYFYGTYQELLAFYKTDTTIPRKQKKRKMKLIGFEIDKIWKKALKTQN